ncbi:MAG: type II toxin-antitoxin system RelE/ParE family toxin, partial [Anditalea sp.]
ERRSTVSWTKSAYISFQKAYENIKENSPASAEKVKDTILFMTRNLPDHPEKYPLDRFKQTIQVITELLKNTPIG